MWHYVMTSTNTNGDENEEWSSMSGNENKVELMKLCHLRDVDSERVKSFPFLNPEQKKALRRI